nr:MAG: capsid protein [Cressdnaviricota sp.]
MPYGKYTRKQPMGRRKKASTAKVSAPVQTAIVRAVRRANPQEVKFASSWNSQMAINERYGTLFNSGIGANNNQLLPEIPQGVDVGQRTGDRINPKRLVVDFWVTAANLANNLDFVARLLVLQSRKVKDPLAVGALNMAALLDYGQGQKGFEGYTSDLSMPINKEEFTVISDRLITMDKTYGFNPAATNSYSSSAQGQSQGLIHHYRVIVKCPKVLHYNGSTTLFPDGFAPFFNCGYAQPSRANGLDTPDTVVTALSVQWSSTLYYTDA